MPILVLYPDSGLTITPEASLNFDRSKLVNQNFPDRSNRHDGTWSPLRCNQSTYASLTSLLLELSASAAPALSSSDRQIWLDSGGVGRRRSVPEYLV